MVMHVKALFQSDPKANPFILAIRVISPNNRKISHLINLKKIVINKNNNKNR
jgi:hypothetical protein